jgi:nicotinamidase-related amidase
VTARSDDSVLVVIDVQERLAAAMPNTVRKRMIEQINVLLTAAKKLSIPVIVTEQYPRGLGSTEVDLQLPPQANVIEKTAFSCVKAEGFSALLEHTGRKQIILAGMETHICVLQTAIDLTKQDYEVHVIEDAVCSRSKMNQYNALQRLRVHGATISNVESALFEWLEDASHPAFKELSKLIL